MTRWYLLPLSEAEKLPREWCMIHFPLRMAKANRFVRYEDRLRCIGAGALLHGVLGIRECDILYEANGKPYVPGGDFFSLAHSGNATLLARGSLPIGCDCEEINLVHLCLADTVLTEEERAWMTSEPEKCFFQLWTLKESVLKLAGTGMSTDPGSFSVLRLAVCGEDCLFGKHMFARSFVNNQCAFAICAVSDVRSIKFERVSAEECISELKRLSSNQSRNSEILSFSYRHTARGMSFHQGGYNMNTIKINKGNVQMVAHRGCSSMEMENTAAAFVAAGNRSYFGIETDIHRTKDGKYIIIHDDDTSRVAGDAILIEESTFETLRNVRLFDQDNGKDRRDLILPSLEEYIQICKKYEKDAVLELKNHFEPEDIDNVLAIIDGLGWLEHVIFISFDLPNVVYVRSKLPAQRIQFLASHYSEDLLKTLCDNKLDLDIRHTEVNPEMVKLFHENGVKINVWTVNTVEDAERVISAGVDFITTNTLE